MSVPGVLGLVIARGGSRGLPRKNVLPLGGKPLILHTLDAARGAHSLARVLLSTDDVEISALARGGGFDVPFVRPSELAGDRSSTVDVALHALDWLEREQRTRFEIVTVLPATAPLRGARDIDAAVGQLLAEPGAEAVVAVTEADYPPWWMFAIESGRLVWHFPEGRKAEHRQELPRAFRPNGSIYAIRVAALRDQRTFYPRHTAPYQMPRDVSVNIDSSLDLALAETLLLRRPPSP
jgi:CMP-N-acetylneuraminic acid synthetase